MLSQTTSIIVNWEIQQDSMLWKPNMSTQICWPKACLYWHSNTLELVQLGFLSWGTQKNLSPTSVAYGQCSRAFWDISKGECCSAYFSSQCNKLEKQPCNLGVIAAVKKIYKCLLLKNVLSSTGQWQPTVTKIRRF